MVVPVKFTIYSYFLFPTPCKASNITYRILIGQNPITWGVLTSELASWPLNCVGLYLKCFLNFGEFTLRTNARISAGHDTFRGARV